MGFLTSVGGMFTGAFIKNSSIVFQLNSGIEIVEVLNQASPIAVKIDSHVYATKPKFPLGLGDNIVQYYGDDASSSLDLRVAGPISAAVSIASMGGGNDTVFGANGFNYFFGGDGNDTLIGGDLPESLAKDNITDFLEGGNGADKLDGKGGKDSLNGGSGIDVLTGGAGQDIFVFNTKIQSGISGDKITDFSAADDVVHLDNAIFKAVTGTGTLTSVQFYKSSAGMAHDSNDRIVYETDTGKLFYDADGNGKGLAIEIATLINKPSITNADIFII